MKSYEKMEQCENLNDLVRNYGFDNLIEILYLETKEGRELFLEYCENEVGCAIVEVEGDDGDALWELWSGDTLSTDEKFWILDECGCIEPDMLRRCREDYNINYGEFIDFDEKLFIGLLRQTSRDKKLEGLGIS